ncbi:unnamed protein product [Rhizoctonia solani]|uniref:Protein kinase domain-containing protein n=1 Tax=Rhizoctonia solani TaxID=456999 RepID=A0A8H3H0M4_9AGAM|nr:unnamed protein product [Rhizoctonia solani]
MGAFEVQKTPEASLKTSGDRIGRETTIGDIFTCLTSRGCPDLTEILLTSKCSEFAIATGGLADIFSATLATGNKVGLKSLRLQPGVDQNEESQSQLKRAAHELYVWSKCKHPNILPLIGVAEFRGRMAMISPWMDNGNLFQFLSRNPDVDRYEMCIQIAEGVSYLHDAKLVHGDIKAYNILVTSDRRPQLTDFGSASLKDYTLKFSTTTYVAGTSLRWTAPEILLQEMPGRGISPGGDVYALGMEFASITYAQEVLTGMVPYAGMSDIMVLRRVQASEPPERSSICPDWFWLLIASCWSGVDSRPTSTEIRSRLKAHLFCERLQSIVPALPRSSRLSEARNQTKPLMLSREEIVSRLARSNCPNITRQIGEPKLSEYPIASGRHNDVFCTKLVTGTVVALKILRREHPRQGEDWAGRVQELRIWSKCNHPNVLKVIGTANIRFAIAIVMPWMKYGNLEDFLGRHPGENRYKLSVGIASGVAYLHKIQIVCTTYQICIPDIHRILMLFGNQTHGCIEGVSFDSVHTSMNLQIWGTNLAISNEVYAGTLVGHLPRRMYLEDKSEFFANCSPLFCQANILVSEDRIPKIAGFGNAVKTNRKSATRNVGPRSISLLLSDSDSDSDSDSNPNPNPSSSYADTYFKFNSDSDSDSDSEWRNIPACQSRHLTLGSSDALIGNAFETDVFALGLTILEAFSGGLASLGLNGTSLPQRMLQFKFNTPQRPQQIPRSVPEADQLWNLLNRCWSRDPEKRPSAAHLYSTIASINKNYCISGIQDYGTSTHPAQETWSNLAEMMDDDSQWFSPEDPGDTVLDIISKLGESGCPNVTDVIRTSNLHSYPQATGGFGYVYCGTSHTGNLIGIKCPKLYFSSPAVRKRELVIHGDIKGVNVVVSSDGTPKIIDFGGAVSPRYSDFRPGQNDRRLAGSLRWMAPERLIPASQPTYEADVYALAMTFLEVITGTIPYANTTEDGAVIRKIISATYPEFPELMSEARQDTDRMWPLLLRCWSPSNRPAARKVLSELEKMNSPGEQSITKESPQLVSGNKRKRGQEMEKAPAVRRKITKF